MAMFAAGLCAPGCGAVVSALAGGPILGAVSVAAAIGYGIYALSSKPEAEFQDAVEEEEGERKPIQPVVRVAMGGGQTARLKEGEAQKSFL